jgi:hypothetical protein
MKKIHITSVDKSDGAWVCNELNMRELAKYSSHVLTEDIADADIIFVCNVREDRDQYLLRNNREIGPHIDRCVGLSDDDNVYPLLRGIYASGAKHVLSGRVRSGSYTIYDQRWANPFIGDGGGWNMPKKWLASFVGRMSHPCRQRLLSGKWSRSDILLQDSSNFQLWSQQTTPDHLQAKRHFAEIIASSKFVLCPRGNGASSLRLFECLKFGVSPVIQSDDWLLPKGPKWEEFAIILPEFATHAQIELALTSNESRYIEMGKSARTAWETSFRPEVYFDYLVVQAEEIMKSQIIPERLLWRFRHLFPLRQRILRKARKLLKT